MSNCTIGSETIQNIFVHRYLCVYCVCYNCGMDITFGWEPTTIRTQSKGGSIEHEELWTEQTDRVQTHLPLDSIPHFTCHNKCSVAHAISVSVLGVLYDNNIKNVCIVNTVNSE